MNSVSSPPMSAWVKKWRWGAARDGRIAGRKQFADQRQRSSAAAPRFRRARGCVPRSRLRCPGGSSRNRACLDRSTIVRSGTPLGWRRRRNPCRRRPIADPRASRASARCRAEAPVDQAADAAKRYLVHRQGTFARRTPDALIRVLGDGGEHLREARAVVDAILVDRGVAVTPTTASAIAPLYARSLRAPAQRRAGPRPLSGSPAVNYAVMSFKSLEDVIQAAGNPVTCCATCRAVPTRTPACHPNTPIGETRRRRGRRPVCSSTSPTTWSIWRWKDRTP